METSILVNFSAFFIMFSSIYLSSYFLLLRNWSPKQRAAASSCLISLAHGTPVVFMAIYAITDTQYLSTHNTSFQNTVLEYSIAYFLTDLFHYIIFLPHDILFIIHHLATLYVLATCRYLVYSGAVGILVILILAEVTSAVQNVWCLAGLKKSEVPAAGILYEFLSLPFYVLYSVVRGIVGPLFVYKMWLFDTTKVEAEIPKWAWISWLVVITIGILLSVFWVLNNWIDWFRERSCRTAKKVR